jgi:hypothetical protein
MSGMASPVDGATHSPPPPSSAVSNVAKKFDPVKDGPPPLKRKITLKLGKKAENTSN